MDKVDITLCRLLLSNSRLSYRELADKLNLSVTAVHSRIQSLMNAGVIRHFTAKISLSVLKAVPVVIFGLSKIGLVKGLESRLANHGSIYWLAIGSGNMVYVGAYLKGVNELGSIVQYLKEEAKLLEPTVGIVPLPNIVSTEVGSSNLVLHDLDYKIIRCLKDNSRKTISEAAYELNVSAKTLHRRLSRMMKLGLIELSMEWYPDRSNDIITVFHINVKPEADKYFIGHLFEKYPSNMIFYWEFSNILNFYLAFFWASAMKEVHAIREGMENERMIQSVSPNILYTGYIFETWRDRLLEM